MPVTVIVGGQFGSEGKGKAAHFFAGEQNADIAVRVGGANSGHTVIDQLGYPTILRQLPTASLIPHVYCVLGAGSYIDTQVLLKEVQQVGLTPERLLIAPNAMIITDKDRQNEQNSRLRQRIGSTLSGTGASVLKRIERSESVKLAQHEPLLQPYIKPVVPFMREFLDQGKRIIIEGTQGFGLSLLHSQNYPYVTSRDTTASAFVSEAGLSPLDVDQIVLVLRAFPIRVAGNSGDLPNEIDWNTVSLESVSHRPIVERTSVTGFTRRVARFHPEVVRQAIMINQPTHIVMNHLDYIDSSCAMSNHPSEKVNHFIRNVESMIGAEIDYLGFSPASLIRNLKTANVNYV